MSITSKGPRLHTKGPKVQRDRAICVQKYRELTDYFWWKKAASDEQLSRLNPQAIYNLAEDFFNSLSTKQRNKYAEHLGVRPRSNPLAFGWFLHDLFKYSRRPRIWLVISAPFRYPRFVARVKAREALAKALREAEASKE